MMDEHDIDEFYRQLVRDNQNGGISMHSIYRSEIAHFQSVKSAALQDMVHKVIASQDTLDIQGALSTLNTLGLSNKDEYAYSLCLALNALSSARQIVNDKLASQVNDKSYWEVQDLVLGLMESQKDLSDLTTLQLQQLQAIASRDEAGTAVSIAILTAIGEVYQEPLILPNRTKRLLSQQDKQPALSPAQLTAYPNPSNGPVFLVYTVPEGVEKAEITVFDAQGRMINTSIVPPNGGIFEINERSLSTGLHVVNLTCDGISVGSTKVNIVR